MFQIDPGAPMPTTRISINAHLANIPVWGGELEYQKAMTMSPSSMDFTFSSPTVVRSAPIGADIDTLDRERDIAAKSLKRNASSITFRSETAGVRIKRRALLRQIADEARGRERFNSFGDTELAQTEKFFIRRGCLSVGEIISMAERDREYSLEDIRGEEALPISGVELASEFPGLFGRQPRRRH